MQLRDNMLDLDELDDGVVLSDFTLDYFFDQLLRYLEKNKDALDATPDGAYAVTHNEKRPGRNGCHLLSAPAEHQRGQKGKKGKPDSPTFMRCISRSDGDIRHGCTSTRQVLDLFEAAAVGKTEAATKTVHTV